MNLNYIKLSKSQAELDSYISQEKQIEHTERLKEKAISLCVELGELLNERPFIFKYWSNKTGDREKALFEYVDGIHFFFSYGNAIEFDFESFEYKQPKEMDQRDLVLGLFAMTGSFQYTNQFEDALNHYLFLAEKLNFTQEEIEQAYFHKNDINFSRQENGY